MSLSTCLCPFCDVVRDDPIPDKCRFLLFGLSCLSCMIMLRVYTLLKSSTIGEGLLTSKHKSPLCGKAQGDRAPEWSLVPKEGFT